MLNRHSLRPFQVALTLGLMFTTTALSVTAQTLIHYRLNNTDAATVANDTVPNLGTLGAGTVIGTSIALSTDIPTNGVPPGYGNRSINGGGNSGIGAPGTRQLSRTNISNAGGFTYEAWFKTDGSGTLNDIIDYAGTEKLIRQVGDTGPVMESDNALFNAIGAASANQWHYVAVVFTPTAPVTSTNTITGDYTFYLDTNTPTAGAANIMINAFGDSLNRTIGVAAHPAGFASDYFHGLIYEPRVTLGALPAASLLFKPSVVVTNIADSGPGTLRDAVANAPDGAVITFDPSLTGRTLLLTTGTINLSKNVIIDASTLPGGMRIDGNHAAEIFRAVTSITMRLDSLTLTDGVGTDGGAFYNDSGSLILTRCNLVGNRASHSGGGIVSGGPLILSGCTFSGNTAVTGSGGGLLLSGDGSVNATNCTFTGNSGSTGGACKFNSGTSFFSQVTIFGNTATEDNQGGGGGIAIGASVTLINSIVAGNTALVGAGADINFPFGTLVGSGTNLIGNNDTVSGIFPAGPLVGTQASPLNPQLAPLGSYGGPTPTMPPLPGSSPALNAADDTAAGSLATDQRGSIRKFGSHVDIGAAESGGLWVQNTGDTGAGSLRNILTNAAATVTGPKIINFVPGLTGQTITLASQLLVTDTNGVTVDASALANGIEISGNAVTRVFFVTNGAVATLNSLTIDYGLAPTGSFAQGGGGGGLFCNSGGQVGLLNCSVLYNLTIAVGSGHAYAGGIACNNGRVGLTNCTVAFNQVFGANGEGGACYNFAGTLILDHCTVAYNQAATCSGIVVAGVTVVKATVLANGNGDLPDFGGLVSLGHNFIVDGTDSGLANGANGDQIETGGSPSDAHLASLGNYGGPTQTMPPLPGSPLVNTGSAATTATDQRGYARFLSTASDIGAVEGIYNANLSINLTATTHLPDGSVRFGFTNLTDQSFTVLATTNITDALNAWTPIGTALESPLGSGQFQFTDPQTGSFPQRFYRVKSP